MAFSPNRIKEILPEDIAFSDSQIIAMLKQAMAGSPALALCREHGSRSATLYKWRTKFGDMDASLMTRLRHILKRLPQANTVEDYKTLPPWNVTAI